MSNSYDNWERLVGDVLRREQFRQLARQPSSSSMSSMSISEPGYPVRDDHDFQLKYPYSDVKLYSIDGEMGVSGNKGKRDEKIVAGGHGIEPAVLDDIINHLLPSRNAKIGRQVQLLENEIRALCNASREIFLSKPNLLELEAPIKNCGNIHVAAIIDDKIFFVNDGLSPELIDLDKIRNLPRPADVPDTGLLTDLLWSDTDFIKGWGMTYLLSTASIQGAVVM